MARKRPVKDVPARLDPGAARPAVSFWTAVRVVTGLLFAVSGFEKLVSPYQNFQFVIEQYQVVGGEQAAWIAKTLPWAELVAGAFFLLGLWTPAAGAAILALFGVFIVAVGQALVRRLPMDECGCFGELISIPLPVVLVMDLTLAALVAWGLRLKPGLRAAGLDERL
jgi:hypothetical protein